MSRTANANVTPENSTNSGRTASRGGGDVTFAPRAMSRSTVPDVTPWSRADAARWLAAKQWEMRFSDGGCWTVAQVKAQMKEAIDVCERTTRRDKPSEKTGFWPAAQIEWDEMVGQVQTGELFELYRARNARGAGVASRREIARMEQAVRWPAEYLLDDRFQQPRLAFKAWAFAQACGLPFLDVVKRLRRPYSTMNLLRDDALLIITCGLVRDGVGAK